MKLYKWIKDCHSSNESGNGINKQAYPVLVAMLVWLGLLYLPLALRWVGLI